MKYIYALILKFRFKKTSNFKSDYINAQFIKDNLIKYNHQYIHIHLNERKWIFSIYHSIKYTYKFNLLQKQILQIIRIYFPIIILPIENNNPAMNWTLTNIAKIDSKNFSHSLFIKKLLCICYVYIIMYIILCTYNVYYKYYTNCIQ
jgi:hypothetical protein